MSDITPKTPDAINKEMLEAMQFVARMKESADRLGVGFIGGFVAPDGQKFVMTNMDEDDQQNYLPDTLK
jgi:hypothetical protein